MVSLTVTTLATDTPPDANAMEGEWTPIKAELAGQPVPEAALKQIVLKLHDGKYEAIVAGTPDRGTYKLDPAAKPRAITITGTEGPNRGKTIPAIYELQGDTLRVCYDLSGAKRPVGFTTAGGGQLYLVTYARNRSGS